jgi:hypothetical protein
LAGNWRKSAASADEQLRVLWRQQHAAEVGRFLRFAERAELGVNVEVQKQKFEGPCLIFRRAK